MKSFGIGAGAALLAALVMGARPEGDDHQTKVHVGDEARVTFLAQAEQPDAGQREGQAREARKVPQQQSREAASQQQKAQKGPRPTKATAVLFPVGDSGVSGLVTIEQQGQNRVLITGTVRGLEPNSRHGFHIHEFGDLSDLEKGQSVGGHFAPEGSPHGRPTDPPGERHAGDLGNIEANDQGVAEIRIEDEIVSLHGPKGVIGRAFVVHSQADEFTQPSGDAGDRIAFGTIGIAKPEGGSSQRQTSQR